MTYYAKRTRKRLKNYGRDALTIGATGIGLGAVASIPGGEAAGGMSRALPVAGGVIGAGMVLGSVTDLQRSLKPKNRRGKKRW